MKILLFVFMFFILSALLIISNNNLAFIDDENINKFVELYSDWANQVYLNAQTISGNAVKMNWWPAED